MLGRLGGDEFGVIMAQCDAATGTEKAQSLLAVVASKPLRWDGHVIPVSLSVGVCPFSGSEELAAMLQAADRAMYSQKGNNARSRPSTRA